MPAERSWAAEWIGTLLAHENVALTPEVKEARLVGADQPCIGATGRNAP